MCFLYSIFSKKNKEKGFSLLELLVAMGIAGFITILVTNNSEMNMRTLVSSKGVMDKQQLYESMAQTIGSKGDSCKGNISPTVGTPPTSPGTNTEGLWGSNSVTQGVGELVELYSFKGSTKQGTPLVKVGDFGQNLEVVKMKLEDPSQSVASAQAKKLGGVRVFTIFYKHRQGSFKTKSGSACTTTDQAGCYSLSCSFSAYNVGDTNIGCQATTCPPLAISGLGGSGTVDCYKVDETGKTFVGCDSAKQPAGKDTTGTGNAFFGYEAGNANRIGKYNTLIGYKAGKKTIGDSNTFMGYQAGQNNIGGINNTFIGLDTGKANTTGNDNVFIGTTVGVKSNGGQNVFIGAYSGLENISGGKNVFIGHDAGLKNTAGENLFIGYEAGEGNTTGTKNVFIGVEAGKSAPDANPAKNVTGDENVAIGYQAGSTLTDGKGNVFIGKLAGKSTTGNDYNTFIGTQAGENNTAGDNIFIGTQAGSKNTGGGRNTIVGTWAGSQNTVRSGNTFFGYNAGNRNTGGSNTFIGENAGKDNTTGDNNVIIGKEAGMVLNSGTDKTTKANNNIFIGHEASKTNGGGVSETGSHQLNIGNLIFGKMPSSAPASTIKFLSGQPTTSRYLKEIVNTSDSSLPNAGVVINGNLYVRGRAFANCKHNGTCGPWSTSLGTPSSSKIHKKNITPFVEFEKSLTDITTTPLFTYEYKEDHPDHQRMGIIAEDLPPHLQIKDQYEPVKPDWVSIYGTFWASIKALFNKVTNLTKSILRLNSITSSLKVNLYEVKEKLEDLHGVKDRLEVLEKETQFLRKQNKELKKDNKELKRQIKTLNKKMKVSQ